MVNEIVKEYTIKGFALGDEILNNSGSISHKEAIEKAEKEYEKFRVIQDQKYISSMDEFYKKYLNENKYN